MRGQPARVQPMANGETPLAWSQADQVVRTATGTTTANGRVDVTHNLGWTPSDVFIQMRGSGGPYGTYVTTPTSTIFTVQFYALGTGAPASINQSVTFSWIAYR